MALARSLARLLSPRLAGAPVPDRLLVLDLPLAPELEGALADPEQAQAVKEEAHKPEIAQEDGVAQGESQANEDYARNDAFHNFFETVNDAIEKGAFLVR